jgi:hypothetical protein
MKKEYPITYFFGERKVIRFQKNFENHVATFSYWFFYGKLPCLNFLNFKACGTNLTVKNLQI